MKTIINTLMICLVIVAVLCFSGGCPFWSSTETGTSIEDKIVKPSRILDAITRGK